MCIAYFSDSVKGGGSAQPRLMQTPLEADPPRGRPLWTEWLTDASENITLPQTSFAGSNKETGDEENYKWGVTVRAETVLRKLFAIWR